MGVGEKFQAFYGNLTVSNVSDISYRYKRITTQLNWDFRRLESDTANSMYVGSYGRDTAISGFSDLDMIYILPPALYTKYNNYIGNGQSALLQEIRKSLISTYPATKIGADGQVVVITFTDGMCFEIVPVFENTDKSFTYPDSNGGGSWKTTNPKPEINLIASANKLWNYNLKPLCRIARVWKRYHSVPIGGLLIDTFAYNFMCSWAHKDKSFLYYDYLTRDFLKYVSERSITQNAWSAVGSGQMVYRKGKFENTAKKCYNLALEAIEYEQNSKSWSATQKWREIYGSTFPNIS